MKTLILVSLLMLGSTVLSAQDTYSKADRKRDSLKLDSLGLSLNLSGSKRILGKLIPKRLSASGRVCFDKKISFFSNVNGKQRRGCFYVNTIDGLVGVIMDGNQSCDGFAALRPGNTVSIYSKFGEAIIYEIDKKGKKTFHKTEQYEIDHTISGGVDFRFKNPSYRGPATVFFTNNSLPSRDYVMQNSSASAATWWFFGVRFPATISLRNYLGQFGLGFFDGTDNRTYICMGVERPNFYVKIERIDEVTDCFDGSSFTIDKQQESTASSRESTAAQDKLLDEKQKDIASSNSVCADVATQIVDQKRILNNKEKAYHVFLDGGGKAESKAGQKLASEAMDIIDKVILERLEQKRRDCDIDYSINMNSNNYPAGTRTKILENLRKEKDCVHANIEKYTRFIQELQSINQRNGINYAKAVAEKNMFYFKNIMPAIGNCRSDIQVTNSNSGREVQEQLNEIRKKNRRQ